MDEQRIVRGLENGRFHPYTLLEHLVDEGDEEGARLVAEIGTDYVRGTERMGFVRRARELVPEAFAAKDAKMAERSREEREEREAAFAANLKARANHARSMRGPGSARGWQAPPRRER